jgi:hypothetical protein
MNGFFPEEPCEIESRLHEAKVARIKAEQARVAEEARRIAEEQARLAEEARRIEDAAVYSFTELHARVEDDVRGCLERAVLQGTSVIDDLVVMYGEVVERENVAAALYNIDIRRKVRFTVDIVFLLECIKRAKALHSVQDRQDAYDKLFGADMFASSIAKIKATEVDVYGGKKKLSDQVIVDFNTLVHYVLKGGVGVVDAPMQCGKTGCAATVAIISRFACNANVLVVGASKLSVKQMIKSKMPDFVNAFGIRVVTLDKKFIDKLTPEMIADVKEGKIWPIALWTELDKVMRLRDILGCKINLTLDEVDEFITHSDLYEQSLTYRETQLGDIYARLGDLNGILNVSSTLIGFQAWKCKRNIRIDTYMECMPEALARKEYRSVECLKPLTDADGNEIYIDEDDPDFTAAKGYGIQSPKMKMLFDRFNVPVAPGQDGIPGTARVLFLSLGSRVSAEGGFDTQAEFVLRELSPHAIVFIMSSGGVDRAILDDNGIFKDPMWNQHGSRSSINEAMAEFHRMEQARIVVLGQGCCKRSISICTDRTSINYSAIFATNGMNLSDLVQLFGRLFGYGPAFKGDVVGLWAKKDFLSNKVMREFTREAILADIRGEDFMNCEALSDPKFAVLLDAMKRSFHRKKNIHSTPQNAERMKRRRIEEALRDPGVAGPSNRGREQDPDYVPPRRLRGWECILLALHGTPCYTEGASMPAAQVKELSVPILEARNLTWRQHAGISNLKNRGFIEKLHGVVKLTPTGKAACDEVFSRG